MTADPIWSGLDDEADPPTRPLASVMHSRRHTVISLVGEHDIANEGGLLDLLAETVSLDDSNVVLDLGGVAYMSASTVHVIQRTREYLASESRFMTLRSPSPIARRLLEISHLDYCCEPARLPGLVSEPI